MCRHRPSVNLLLILTLSASTAQAQQLRPPPPPPPASTEKPAGPRIISGFGGKIVVTSKPDGGLQILDENDRARYATDDPREDKRIVRLPNFDLSYKNEAGDAITLHPDDDRTTTIPRLKLTVREGRTRTGQRFTEQFTFGEGVVIRNRPMQGRWMPVPSEPGVWQHVIGRLKTGHRGAL